MIFRRTPTRRAQIPGTDIDYPRARLSLFDKLAFLASLHKLFTEIKMKKASWKTTLGGILAASGPIAKNILPTEWDWVGDALMSIGALVLGLAARDNSVSSAAAGVQ
jgi:hypothetical protein